MVTPFGVTVSLTQGPPLVELGVKDGVMLGQKYTKTSLINLD